LPDLLAPPDLVFMPDRNELTEAHDHLSEAALCLSKVIGFDGGPVDPRVLSISKHVVNALNELAKLKVEECSPASPE
jgi:hypothetical protein